MVARSLDCVVCGRGQARASHTHCHYKRVVAEARTEEGCFGRIVTTRLWLMVTIMGGGGAEEPWSRCGPWTATLSRRGRDRVTTRVVAESKAASDEQGDGSVMDLMHHTTSSFIPSTYAICAERYRGKSSR